MNRESENSDNVNRESEKSDNVNRESEKSDNVKMSEDEKKMVVCTEMMTKIEIVKLRVRRRMMREMVRMTPLRMNFWGSR